MAEADSFAPDWAHVMTGLIVSLLLVTTVKVPFKSEGVAPDTIIVEPTGKPLTAEGRPVRVTVPLALTMVSPKPKFMVVVNGVALGILPPTVH